MVQNNYQIEKSEMEAADKTKQLDQDMQKMKEVATNMQTDIKRNRGASAASGYAAVSAGRARV